MGETIQGKVQVKKGSEDEKVEERVSVWVEKQERVEDQKEVGLEFEEG